MRKYWYATTHATAKATETAVANVTKAVRPCFPAWQVERLLDIASSGR
jgi:hypothetical protein